MDFSRLENYMDSLPGVGYHGASIVVAKDGQTVFSHSAGFKDRECKIPSSPDDMYWIFSCTKPLLCVAALMLVEQGKLSMSDPVFKYLPEYKELYVQEPDGRVRRAKSVMTVEHLFTMTGGLSYDLSTANVSAACIAEGATTRSIVASFAKDPLSFDPGSQFQYSLCHDVLGAVVEVVTGERLCDYMDRVLFQPLHMNHTSFHPDKCTRDNMGALYYFNSGNYSSFYTDQNNPYVPNENYDSGGAGICSNAADYIKFLSALSMNRLLKPETIASLGVNRLSPEVMKTFYPTRLFGYGWGYCGRCHISPAVSGSPSAVGEFGWDGAGNDFALADPTNRIAFFFSTGLRKCQYGYHFVHPKLRELVYDALK